MINIFPANDEVFGKMKGLEFVPQSGEGVVYIKLVALKPDTITNGDPKTATEDAPAVVLCGNLDAIKAQFIEWFDQLSKEYQA
jgi:hypothetical protein